MNDEKPVIRPAKGRKKDAEWEAMQEPPEPVEERRPGLPTFDALVREFFG